MSKKIIFSAGGTGGHIFPAINLMKHFSEKGYDVILVTDKRGNAFISNYSQFRSYILTSGTPTNKNFLNKIFLEKDEFLKLSLLGLVSLLIIQTFIHIGVNIRLLPTTGMTLPFLSYGGSSLIGSAFIAGIILNFTKKDSGRYLKNE